MGLKDSLAKGVGAAVGFAGCMAYAGWALGGLVLWGLATAWYAKEWGILGVLANIVLMPIFMIAFPFIFWMKEGMFPWLWVIIFLGMFVVQWFVMSLFKDRW